MKKQYGFAVVVLMNIGVSSLSPHITVGQGGGFVVDGGATLACGSVYLADGVIKNKGGVITGSPICSNVAIETTVGAVHRSMVVTGGALLGTSICLGDNQLLKIDGSAVAEAVSVGGSLEAPSMLQGEAAAIGGGVWLATSTALIVKLCGALSSDIWLEADEEGETRLILESDLSLAPGFMIKAGDSGGYNRVLCNGSRLHLGGNLSTWPTLFNTLRISDAALCLSGQFACADASTLHFETDGFVEGAGNRIVLGAGVSWNNGGNAVRLSNVTFQDVSSSTFAGTGTWIFDNCRLIATDGASVTLDAIATGGAVDIFGTGGAAFMRGTIALNSDVALQGCLTVGIADYGDPQPTVTIQGNGYTLNMTPGGFGDPSGAFHILEGSILKLNNVIVQQLKVDSLFDSFSTLAVSNVTFVLASTVDWSSSGVVMRVQGPTVFVVGDYTFTASSVSYIAHGVTVWCDPLRGAGQVLGFSEVVGRVAQAATSSDVYGVASYVSMAADDISSLRSDVTELQGQVDALGGSLSSYIFNASSDPCGLFHDIHLYGSQADGSHGVSLIFNGGDSFIFDGFGRSVFFGRSSLVGVTPNLMAVALDTRVETRRVTLDGLSSRSYEVAGNLYFGDGTCIRLDRDWTGDERLSKTMTFGTFGEDIGCIAELDLNGHTLDMSHEEAFIELVNSGGGQLHIRNGRITNLSGAKLSVGYGMLLTFHNVDIVLSGNVAWSSFERDLNTARLRFAGACSLSGIPGSYFSNASLGDVIIAENSTLQIRDGIVYNHQNAGVTNFVMENEASVLEIIGATFRHPDVAETGPLVLSGGTLICDQRVCFMPGSAGISFGLESEISELNRYLDVVLRPGAQCVVSADMDATPGQLFYANAELP